MHKNAVAFISCLVLLFGSAAAEASQASPANKAARIRIVKFSLEAELAGSEAPEGKAYLVLQTEWENIHPKQKVKKSDLEGKPDRTMGVGGLMGKKKETKEEEYVDADVAYLVPNLFDHVYCLADGQSLALDGMTGDVPGGIDPQKEFMVAKLGEKKILSLVFLLPDEAKNLAFQLFDYSYGHILVPIRGDLSAAVGKGAPGKALGSVKDEKIELAALKMDLRPEFEEEEAPEGWRYAVVDLGGKSLSSSGGIGNIIQVDPAEYLWLQTKDGYLYYCISATTTEDGYVRFTPEVFQTQQLRFLVPAGDGELALGIRIENKVYSLPLTPHFSLKIPKAFSSHRDGKTMDIQVYGARREDGRLILDLGIQSRVDSGIEIQTAPQFMIEAEGETIEFDEGTTAELLRRPPEPFTIPPRTFIRFELAYETEAVPTSLRYRGYESEGTLAIPGLK
jgi:hypothetical protein